jgi:ribose 5-phosphate isomerase A
MFAKLGSSRLRGVVVGMGGLSIYSAMNHYQNTQATKCDRSNNSQKVAAGYKCVDDYVKSNMVIGLGSGRSVQYALSRLGQKINAGDLKSITVVASSEPMAKQAISLGIRAIPLHEMRYVDVTIDSLDEVDSSLNALKGSTGTFAREKKLHKASKAVVFLCDEGELIKNLGPGSILPVEVVPDIESDVLKSIESLHSMKGAYPIYRRGSIDNTWLDGFEKVVTENGNHVVDLFFDRPIADAKRLVEELEGVRGVVAHGLVLRDPKYKFLVGTEDGVRLVGQGGERAWWVDKPARKNLLDNVMPSSSSWP